MIRHKAVGWTTLALIGLLGTYVAGQDESAAELYGRGVHAYFAGDMPLAIGLLSESIEKNGLDPRAYYFRGLATAANAGIDAGRADFAAGADIEFNKIDRYAYDINAALQRVQGYLRLEIEKQRAATRKAAAELQKKRDRVRYEELKRREDIVLYDPNRPAPQVEVDIPKTEIPQGEDPFASGTAFTGGKQVDYVAPEPVEPGDAGKVEPADAQPRDPFAAPGAKPPTEPVDPFATPPKEPDNPFGEMGPAAEKPKAEEEAGDVNPFGDDMPVMKPEADASPGPPSSAPDLGKSLMDMLGKTLSGKASDRDPFADSETKEPAEQPPKPPADDDPFGGSGAKQEPAKEKPPAAAPDEDPFGGSGTKQEPAKNKRPADNDPFK